MTSEEEGTNDEANRSAIKNHHNEESDSSYFRRLEDGTAYAGTRTFDNNSREETLDLSNMRRREESSDSQSDRKDRTAEWNSKDQYSGVERCEHRVSNEDSDEEAEGELSYRRDEKIEETREIIRLGIETVLETGPSVTAQTPAYKTSPDPDTASSYSHSLDDDNLPDRSRSRNLHRRTEDGDRNEEGELRFKREETVEQSLDVIHVDSTKTADTGPSIDADPPSPGHSRADQGVGSEQKQTNSQRKNSKDIERPKGSDQDTGGEQAFKCDEKAEKTPPEIVRPDSAMPVDDKPVIIVRPTSPDEKDTDESAVAEIDPSEEDRPTRSRKPGRREGGELSYYWHDTVEEGHRPQLAVLARHSDRRYYASSADDALTPESQQISWEVRSASPGADPTDANRLSPYYASDSSSSTLYFRELPDVPSPCQSDILNEIEKLREEHNRMMLLLERTRHRSSPLFRRLHRARSASPCLMHGGSWSSGSGSPVTVIAGFGSVRGSPVTFLSSHSPRLSFSGLVAGAGEESAPGGQNAFPAGGHKRHSIATTTAEDSVDLSQHGGWQSTLGHSTMPGFMLTTSTPDLWSDTRHLAEADDMSMTVSASGGSVVRPVAVYRQTDSSVSQKEHILPVTRPSGEPSGVHRGVSKQSLRHTSEDAQTAAQRDGTGERTARSVTVQNLSSRDQSTSEHQNRTDATYSREEHRRYHRTESRSVTSRALENTFFSRLSEVEMSQPPLDTRHDSSSGSTPAAQPSYSTALGEDGTSANTVASPRSDFTQQDHDHFVSQIVSSFQGNYEAVSNLHESFIEDDVPPDCLIRTPRSFRGENVPPLDHQLSASPSLISTGVEAVVNSSDDFTQTDAEDDSLHLSLMDTSRGSATSTSNTETHRIRVELERLHQERIEIIELLSLKYLPGSLTVELLEAKLNYCLGQTDMLLASLEKAWAEEEPSDLSRQWSQKHEELLSEYRSQFEQSRQDVRVCMEEARRLQHGSRGRRVARTRDLINMQRRAEIEAFKQERKREQDWYDRHRNISPDLPHDKTPRSKFAPRFMTPRQHKEHLVRLRRSLVAASTEELDRLRRRSQSSSISPSPDRSFSPASFASNVFQSRSSSVGSSLSPDRHAPGSNLNTSLSASFSTPSLVTPAAYSSSELKSTTAASSASSLHHASISPRRTSSAQPTPPEPMHYRGPSIPRHPRSYLVPRSSSCGSALSKAAAVMPHLVASPLGHQEPLAEASTLSDSRESLDPEQLLQESYAARQLNRQQISKAQEALRLLEEHRHGFHSQIRSQERRRLRQTPRWQNPREVIYLPIHTSTTPRFSEQAIQQEIANLQQQRMQSPGDSTVVDSGVMSLSLQESVNGNVPPDSTSTPRSKESFHAYAKDTTLDTDTSTTTTTNNTNNTNTNYDTDTTATTNTTATHIDHHERATHHTHSLTTLTTNNTTTTHTLETSTLREQEMSFERSTSDTPSSLLSTDLDSFLDLSTSSTSLFTSTRPISSQDIKARIKRKAKEKMKEME